MNKSIAKHSFTVNDDDNGGEALIITTEIFDNGEEKNNVFLDQEITLNSYCNSASFNLSGAVLTPSKLRELANELESAINKYKK